MQAKLMEERLYFHWITQWQYFKFSFLSTWYWKFPKELAAQTKIFQHLSKIHFMNHAGHHNDLGSVYDFLVPTLEFVICARDLYAKLQQSSATFEVHIQIF